MTTTKTTTTFDRDGTITKVKTTRPRKKKEPPMIGEGSYDTYHQGIHLLCTNLHTQLTDDITKLQAFVKYYPYGECTSKIEAVMKVLSNTCCFLSQVRNWAITKDNVHLAEISEEPTIDF